MSAVPNAAGSGSCLPACSARDAADRTASPSSGSSDTLILSTFTE